MKAKRREKLIKHLEYIRDTEPEAFDLKHWIASESRESLEIAVETWSDRFKKREKLNCGTAACLVGHLPLVFPKHFQWQLNSNNSGRVVYRGFGVNDCELATWFGGSEEEWSRVIYSDRYKDPSIKNVIRKVKRLHTKRLKKESNLI